MEELLNALGDHFTGIRTIRTDGKTLYCVDVSFGNFCYTGKTITEALEKAVNDMPKIEGKWEAINGYTIPKAHRPKIVEAVKGINNPLKPGSRWECIDSDSDYYGQQCVIVEARPTPTITEMVK
jgi:hypothetical protein